jgi:hypothetical protein
MFEIFGGLVLFFIVLPLAGYIFLFICGVFLSIFEKRSKR